MKTFLTLLLVAASLISCTRDNPSQNAKIAELRYGLPSEPNTLDPINPSNTADGRSILFNVFEGLVKPDPKGALLPCAAESWHIGQDGLTYDFRLRGSVYFHDGSPLTSADVQFTLESAIAAGFPGLSQIEKIETFSDADLRITLKHPDSEFLPFLTIGIVKAGNTDREKNINGIGPFFIEKYEIQRSLILRRFSGYWQAPRLHDEPDTEAQGMHIPLEKVSIVFLHDSNALLLALRGGSIDGAGITGSLIQQINDKRFDITPYHSASVHVFALNNAVPALSDRRVRKAINYGVDIQKIIDTAFFGWGEPSGSPLIPGLEIFYNKNLRNPYPYSAAQARALLSQAGYGEAKHNKLSLEITVPSNYAMHIDTAQVIAGMLENIGINTSIKQVDWASWLSDVYRDRRYEATIISLDAINISPRSFLSRYHSASGNNFINFNNANYDRTYEASLTEARMENRIALYKEAQRIISHEAASVYIQDITGFNVFRAGAFGGIINYPLYVIDFASIYWTGK